MTMTKKLEGSSVLEPFRFARRVDAHSYPHQRRMAVWCPAMPCLCSGVVQRALSTSPRESSSILDLGCPFFFYFLPVTTAAIAALQSSPRLARAPRMQVTFWMPPLAAHCCFSMSARHDFPAAATSASLALHTSERSATRSLRQVATRPPPGLMVPQAFLISAAQAPRPDCAVALDTKMSDKAAQINKGFSI
jgi:hypothetical protein